jgi:hypothetical protein
MTYPKWRADGRPSREAWTRVPSVADMKGLDSDATHIVCQCDCAELQTSRPVINGAFMDGNNC